MMTMGDDAQCGVKGACYKADERLSCADKTLGGGGDHVVEKLVKVIINKSKRCAGIASKNDCQHPLKYLLPAYIVQHYMCWHNDTKVSLLASPQLLNESYQM